MMRLATLLPLLFSTVSFIFALYFFLQGQGMLQSASYTYGTIVKTTGIDGQGDLVVRFVAASGQQVSFQSRSELAAYYQEGDTVYVMYNPSQPEQARDAAGSMLKDRTLPMLLALVACALGLIVLVKNGGVPDWSLVAFGRTLIAALGMIFIASGVLGLYQAHQSKDALMKAAGMVVSVVEEQSNPEQPGNYDYNQILYYPIVKFTTATGQHFIFKGDIGSPTLLYKVGDTPAVIYDPVKPHNASLQGVSGVSILKLVLLFSGVVCLVLGFGILRP